MTGSSALKSSNIASAPPPRPTVHLHDSERTAELTLPDNFRCRASVYYLSTQARHRLYLYLVWGM